MTDKVTCLLMVSVQVGKAVSFCEGWLAAGGSNKNEEYLKNCLVKKNLSFLCRQGIREIEVIQQAAWEWCKKNQVPLDFFSGPLCSFALPKDIGRQCDSETLDAIRSVFEKISLA